MHHDTDNAWKDVLEGYLCEFLAFFFPAIHADIDWRQPVELLGTEFIPLVPEALQGKAIADELVKVTLLDGEVAALYIHIDVQGDPDADFRSRMFRYNVRARERYGHEVVSLAVLVDDSPSFRPSAYEYSRWSFRLRMEFPMVKLLDYRGREKELRVDRNPFSVVVLAHLSRIEASGVKHLYRSKWRLVRLLYNRGYDQQHVRDFLRFLDWIIRLPENLKDKIDARTLALEGRKNMPFLSNIERRSLAKGHSQGLEEGKQIGLSEGEHRGLVEAIALGLELRFGPQSLEHLPRVREIGSVERLRELVAVLWKATTLEPFLQAVERR